MKLTKYRRLAAGVAMVGAGALALLTGPAFAHQQNGNPAAPEGPPGSGRHDVSVKIGGVEKVVSHVRSKVDPCSFNTAPYGPACATPSIVDISAPTFDGTPGQGVTMLLCNGKRAAATEDGGDNDPTAGCDFANGRGLSSIPGFPASSGTFTLNGGGDLAGSVPLTLTSCNGSGSGTKDLLSALGAGTCVNGNASTTCPPTQGQITNGWTCVVTVAEFDPVALTAGTHVGFRSFFMKSPIPSKLCDLPPTNGVFTTCGSTIPAGQPVRLTGVRFPCKEIRPVDPSLNNGTSGSCIQSHNNKQVLHKPSAGGPVGSAVVTAQNGNPSLTNNGDYTIDLIMPDIPDATLWKLVPHAQACPAPGFNQGSSGYAPPDDWVVDVCESGLFNAAGVLVQQ